MSSQPCVIVLAAGQGRRFGAPSHKLEQPLGASTVLSNCLTRVMSSGLPMVVVTTSQLAESVQALVARSDMVVVPADAHGAGMGLSIAAGVQARPQADGWLVMPADMPLVRASTLRDVAAALREHPIVYAQHHGRRGHPVGFSSELYSELSRLTGDEGARRVVARFPAQPVEVDDPGVLLDIDTTEDLLVARAYHDAGAR
jgi:molybdenum cofactor cytidylyltransferase